MHYAPVLRTQGTPAHGHDEFVFSHRRVNVFARSWLFFRCVFSVVFFSDFSVEVRSSPVQSTAHTGRSVVVHGAGHVLSSVRSNRYMPEAPVA